MFNSILEILDEIAKQEPYKSTLQKSKFKDGLISDEELQKMIKSCKQECKECEADIPKESYTRRIQEGDIGYNPKDLKETGDTITTFLKPNDRKFIHGGFETIYTKKESQQKHLNGVPWDVFDVYKLAMPYITKDEITVKQDKDFVIVEVKLKDSERPFAKEGKQKIRLNAPSHVQAEFKEGYLEILIKEKEEKSSIINIL